MAQSKKQSDVRGQGGQNVKGVTNVQPIRPTDQNVKSANRPQKPEAEHPQWKPSGEKK